MLQNKTTKPYLQENTPISMEVSGKSGSRSHRRTVVLFPLPWQGHINPMLQLANILYTKGFNITIFHMVNTLNTYNYPHFTFQPILDIENSKSDKKMDSLSVGDHIARVIVINQCGSDSFREELKRVTEPIACLITDALWYFTQSVADCLGISRLVLRTSSLFCLLVYASIPHFQDQGYFTYANNVLDGAKIDHVDMEIISSSKEESMPILDFEEKVLEFPLLKKKDISKMGFRPYKDPITELLANMVKQTKLSSGIIWNSFKELEEPELQIILRDFPVPSFLIGPFHKYFPASLSSLLEQDRTILSWLTLQAPNSVLYVSFGSVAQLDETSFLEIANGLVDSGQPFLWVVRPGFVKGSTWLERLPDGFIESVGQRGRIVKWAPQQEVLAHFAIGAFWTHTGWNSTLESICEGVPMICSPFFGDQSLDARYVSDVWRVGLYLEDGWARKEITSVIRRVMVDEEGEGIRERVRCLKEKVNLCLMKGGSSYESLESLVNHILSF